MSNAQPSTQAFFAGGNVCANCTLLIPPASWRDSRHVIPCAHVLCGDCVSILAAKAAASNKVVCPSDGCESALTGFKDLPVAWCTRRTSVAAAKVAKSVVGGGSHPLYDTGTSATPSGLAFLGLPASAAPAGNSDAATVSAADSDTPADESNATAPTSSSSAAAPAGAAAQVATSASSSACFAAAAGPGAAGPGAAGPGAASAFAPALVVPSSAPSLLGKSTSAPSPFTPPSSSSSAASSSSPGEWGLCAEHKGMVIQSVEPSSDLGVCSTCLMRDGGKGTVVPLSVALSDLEKRYNDDAALMASALQDPLLAESKVDFRSFKEDADRWLERELARISTWRDAEVARADKTAKEFLEAARKAFDTRVQISLSVLSRRNGLRATLREIERELADVPEELSERFGKQKVLFGERRKLLQLITGKQVTLPSDAAIDLFTRIPTLDMFEVKAAGEEWSTGDIVRHATPRLDRIAKPSIAVCELSAGINAFASRTAFPALPSTGKTGAVIPLQGRTPVTVTAIGGDEFLVTFAEYEAPEIWNAANGLKVRELAEKVVCTASALLPGNWIAIACDDPPPQARLPSYRPGNVICIYDLASGFQLRRLTAHNDKITALAHVTDDVDGYLVSSSRDRKVIVWKSHPTRVFEEARSWQSLATPGHITQLSNTLLAVSSYQPARLELTNWMTGNVIRTISFPSGSVPTSSLFPDGSFAGVTKEGSVFHGRVENWNTTTRQHREILSRLCVLNDGSYLVADGKGVVSHCVNHVPKPKFSGTCNNAGQPMLAVVGPRLVVRTNTTLQVME